MSSVLTMILEYSGLVRYFTHARPFSAVCVCDTSDIMLSFQSKTNQTLCDLYLSQMQSGCCKPPTECGYTYVNETVWIPGGDMIGPNPDCMLWNNDQRLLCYQCSSCKAGVLGSLKQSWRKVSVINIVVLIILVIFYVIAYAAYRNVKRMDNDEPAGEARMTKSHPSHFEI